MRYINLTYKRKLCFSTFKKILLIFVFLLVFILVNHDPEPPWASSDTPKRLQTPQVEETVYLPVEIDTKSAHSLMSSSIQSKFQEVGSPLADRIPWLLSECGKYGLNPELVAAVIAQESGWGKSWACQNHFNCVGWGYADSGDMGYHYDSFEEAMEDILASYAVHYNVDTAEEMSARGYNTRQSWVDNVNLIMSYF